MKPLRLLGRRFVADGSFLQMDRLHLISPQGSSVVRDVVRHPGAVAVVPIIDEDVILIEQERIPAGVRMLEIPAGKRDEAGESLETTATRECEEEIGFRPGRLVAIGSIFTTPGFSNERIWLFIGYDLVAVPARPQGIEEEDATVVRVSIREALQKVENGEIVDAKTVVGLRALGREHGQ